MNLHFAVSVAADMVSLNVTKAPRVLVSFSYRDRLEEFAYSPELTLLDSGAFTAWSSGNSVDRDGLISWALDCRARFQGVTLINLDVVPGRKGIPPSRREIEQAMSQSLENADAIRNAGLECVEVFHNGEPLEFLDELLARCPAGGRIAFGGLVGIGAKVKESFLQIACTHLVRRYGYGQPNQFPKVHGLGVTGSEVLQQFPFYSVDSSSFTTPGRFGRYVTERGQSARVEFDSRPYPSRQQFSIESIRNQLVLERDITSLWRHRGITWED